MDLRLDVRIGVLTRAAWALAAAVALLGAPDGVTAAVLLAAAGLLLVRGSVARRRGEERPRAWTWLALLATAAAVDAATGLHHHLSGAVLAAAATAGGVLVVRLLAVRVHLRERVRLVAAGALYATGTGLSALRPAVAGRPHAGVLEGTYDLPGVVRLAAATLLLTALVADVARYARTVTVRLDAAPTPGAVPEPANVLDLRAQGLRTG